MEMYSSKQSRSWFSTDIREKAFSSFDIDSIMMTHFMKP